MQHPDTDGPRTSQATDHVLITGATSGLGWALADHYAAPGILLSLAGRDEERLAAIRQLCEAKGAVVEAAQVDVTDAEAMERWLIARDDVQAVGILIANAGMGGSAVVPGTSGEDGPLARRIVAVNTVGVINSVTPLLPRMTARKRGRVALIGSISGAIGLPQSPVYCASKAAVQIYGDALRRLVRQHGVMVTNVLPGFVDTPMSRSLDMPRPFCWPAEKAARRVARDIASGRRQCVFPWQLRLSIALQNYLPLALTDFVMAMSNRSAR
ncbi:MAG: putative short-chain dehydrogenase/reductase [Xanthobacteraceae bacterium]|nr:MAG: putative short-chain dehydrogenase/reductase [Xanthobacteraceae bacterium]